MAKANYKGANLLIRGVNTVILQVNGSHLMLNHCWAIKKILNKMEKVINYVFV